MSPLMTPTPLYNQYSSAHALLHFDDASDNKEDEREEAAGGSARLWILDELMEESYAVIVDLIRPDTPILVQRCALFKPQT
ncbi:hypothetical protein TEQG_08615 [Trichophyton equinum CBS 127.97]|uniref:Uncharacterized protein n=1 Tax=Trichophyton equinum (strain ATCC MYA-4606 / CBS 127.97) TaxID=559882 RepID=F2PLM9_TRIEC|nr:hypothetical protein TEQG_08615 [Trichophyton equinum CBS 127.97]